MQRYHAIEYQPLGVEKKMRRIISSVASLLFPSITAFDSVYLEAGHKALGDRYKVQLKIATQN